MALRALLALFALSSVASSLTQLGTEEGTDYMLFALPSESEAREAGERAEDEYTSVSGLLSEAEGQGSEEGTVLVQFDVIAAMEMDDITASAACGEMVSGCSCDEGGGHRVIWNGSGWGDTYSDVSYTVEQCRAACESLTAKVGDLCCIEAGGTCVADYGGPNGSSLVLQCDSLSGYRGALCSPSPTPDVVSGTGDPHLSNVRGEHFDIYQQGSMPLLHVPRHAEPPRTLLLVEADARHMYDECSVYFQAVSISGAWTNRSTPIQFLANPHSTPEGGNWKEWMRFGAIDLKVVRHKKGVDYLNVYARNVGHSGYEVGGLLGLDDHAAVSKRPRQCAHHNAAALVASVADVH